jgi:hypothetical protein
MSVSAPQLNLDALQRLRTGAEVLTYGCAGKEDRWQAIDDYANASPDGRWMHLQTFETKADDELVGAFLMSASNPRYRGGSAGMTQSSWGPSWPGPPTPTSWPVPPTGPPPASRAPAAPPRALVPGLRAPTAAEAALLPAGSIIGDDSDEAIHAYLKAVGGDWVDECGDSVGSNWAGSEDEIVLRVGDGTQPGAYLAPDCSPDALVDLLLSRADLRDALAARVPALRDLADALRELVGLQGGGS